MKAIRIHTRSGPEAFVYEDAPQPHPGEGEVLVRIYATSVMWQEPTRAETWKTPMGVNRHLPIPGHDLSGLVAEVGTLGRRQCHRDGLGTQPGLPAWTGCRRGHRLYVHPLRGYASRHRYRPRHHRRRHDGAALERPEKRGAAGLRLQPATQGAG